MYIPPHFAYDNVSSLHDAIERHSFATLVSGSGATLEASHLPLLLDRNEGPYGTLVGHMAHANEQWRRAHDRPVLAIFHGPHAYISPRWYEPGNTVPTWNYVTVHVHGRLEAIDDPVTALALVRRMTAHYEAAFSDPWQLTASAEVLEVLARQIVAFQIRIERIEGKAKLSQNHSAARRQRVIEGLQQLGDEQSREVAAWMARLAPG